MQHIIGENCKVEISSDELVIRVPRTGGRLSSTGKTTLVATAGNVGIPGTDLKLSLNLMRKNVGA